MLSKIKPLNVIMGMGATEDERTESAGREFNRSAPCSTSLTFTQQAWLLSNSRTASLLELVRLVHPPLISLLFADPLRSARRPERGS